MISYRTVLSTGCYVGAVACLVAALFLWFIVAPGLLGIALIGVAAIVLLALAIKFDERL